MKLRITTTYSNVDEAWFSWWLEKYGDSYGLGPGAPLPKFPHVIHAQDETSDVVSITEIDVDAPEIPALRKVPIADEVGTKKWLEAYEADYAKSLDMKKGEENAP